MARPGKDKAAFVTGGAVRLGRAMALRLAQKGYAIALHYRHSASSAKRTAQQIRGYGVACELFQADLNDLVQAQKLIPAVKQRFSGLSLLINNASIFIKDSAECSDPCLLAKHLAVHLSAPYLLTSDFARFCPAGQIINVLDTRIFSDQTDYGSYTLSKKALAEWTRMAAVMLAPAIRVNGIAPGLILAPKGKGARYLKALAAKIPLKRPGRVENILQALDYLLENDFVTGDVLAVDGGEHLR